ncbi:MAG: hypothetical protein CMJ84_05060 [Planctomycetes bacterium]|jgi:division/cell wall cluster transcriptional repressor MraZ|nr:hypothetical protein [Planctomycetota bacterium]MDP6408103.1 hypothetical protein [Planctomycetota bacterium]
MTPHFNGEHPASLDPESRILLPAPLRRAREDAAEGAAPVPLVANLEPEGCLCVRRRDCWERHLADVRGLGPRDARARRLSMLMGATAVEVHYDRQHRLRFPERLLRRAGIARGDEEERSVVVVGHFEDLRFWDRERWASFSAEAQRCYAEDLEYAQASPASVPPRSPSGESPAVGSDGFSPGGALPGDAGLRPQAPPSA